MRILSAVLTGGLFIAGLSSLGLILGELVVNADTAFLAAVGFTVGAIAILIMCVNGVFDDYEDTDEIKAIEAVRKQIELEQSHGRRKIDKTRMAVKEFMKCRIES